MKFHSKQSKISSMRVPETRNRESQGTKLSMGKHFPELFSHDNAIGSAIFCIRFDIRFSSLWGK